MRAVDLSITGGRGKKFFTMGKKWTGEKKNRGDISAINYN